MIFDFLYVKFRPIRASSLNHVTELGPGLPSTNSQWKTKSDPANIVYTVVLDAIRTVAGSFKDRFIIKIIIIN